MMEFAIFLLVLTMLLVSEHAWPAQIKQVDSETGWSFDKPPGFGMV